MQFPISLKEISDFIIVLGSIVSALYLIWTKLILPVTSFGKKRLQSRRARNDEHTLELIKKTTEEVSTPIGEKIESLSKTVDEMIQVNVEQNGEMARLNKKIDKNEVDRIRWELFQFARTCRNGQAPSHEEFEHIFKLHQKYNDLIKESGLTNGEMDMEYAFVKQYYLELFGKIARK